MKGGKSFQDRTRSANVRNMALDHIEKILSPQYKDKKFQKEVLLRLVPTLLPRLNAGRDDDERLIPLPIMDVQENDRNPQGLPTE